jgi:hypothetical protein
MSLINRTYNAIKNLFQKQNRGMVTPDEFNDACKYVQNKIVRETLDFENYLKLNRRVGRGGRIDIDKIKFYKEVRRRLLESRSASFNRGLKGFEYPDDYSFLQALFYKDVEVEEVSNNERSILNIEEIGTSEIFPVYIMHADSIEIIPDTIIRNLEIYYYRNTKDPKYTYNIVSDKLVFNEYASDYQDFDLPDNVYDFIIVELAFYFGIQLKMPDVVQAIDAEDKENEQIKRL